VKTESGKPERKLPQAFGLYLVCHSGAAIFVLFYVGASLAVAQKVSAK
jgi:hypothetical protein